MKKLTKTLLAVLSVATMAASMFSLAACNEGKAVDCSNGHHYENGVCTECKGVEPVKVDCSTGHVDANSDGKCDSCKGEIPKVEENIIALTGTGKAPNTMPAKVIFKANLTTNKADLLVLWDLSIISQGIHALMYSDADDARSHDAMITAGMCYDVGQGVITGNATDGYTATFTFKAKDPTTQEEADATTTVQFTDAKGIYTASFTQAGIVDGTVDLLGVA